MTKWDFLTSTRFWALVIGSASTVLLDPNLPNQKWYITLGKFFALLSAGFVTVRTIDKTAETISGQ